MHEHQVYGLKNKRMLKERGKDIVWENVARQKGAIKNGQRRKKKAEKPQNILENFKNEGKFLLSKTETMNENIRLIA